MTPAVTIEILSKENFSRTALDGFLRKQEVSETYQWIDGKYRLAARRFTEDWTQERKREKAETILGGNYLSCGAFLDGRVIGLLMLEKKLRQGRLVVSSFHVSQDFRKQGIGRRLFCCAVEEGKRRGAKELYFSACSAKETIGFYRAMGCTLADPVIAELAADEPFDLQLVYSI